MNHYTQLVTDHLKTCDLSKIRRESMAESMGITWAVLRARLSAEGTTYMALLETARRSRLIELLKKNQRADAVTIAKHCGYAHGSGALRAVRLWYGVSLREFRKDMRVTG